MLHGHPVRILAQVARPLLGADACIEERILSGPPGARALAGDEVDGIAGEVVNADARALIRVGDGAAALQSPFAGSPDGAVNAARSGRSGGHDAGLPRHETDGPLD